MTDNLVGLDGKPIDKPPPDPQSLLGAVSEAALDPRPVSKFFLVVEYEDPADRNRIDRQTWDSGVTASEAIYMLEATKLDVLMALRDA